MINYYFKLNDDTKKYLLQFRNDFYLSELEDLRNVIWQKAELLHIENGYKKVF